MVLSMRRRVEEWKRFSEKKRKGTRSVWRTVDQDNTVLDILVQSRRNKHAAKKFFRTLLKGVQYVPRVIITDKLANYTAVQREIMGSREHHQHKRLSKRAERSHQPTRQRKQTMRRFTFPGQAQRFLSAPPLPSCFFPFLSKITSISSPG